MFDFEFQIKNLPLEPGVYIMKNSMGGVIYVGKAKNLKNRVTQYFRSGKNSSTKVRAMVSNIAEFEYIITDSEMEALILECNLIKKYRPRYNILLKDDKHYPFIKITINEDFPRLFVTRRKLKDGAKYFGPYPAVADVYETIELLKKIFPIRTCRKSIKENITNDRPCLNFHIKLCSGPCAGKISKEEYGLMIQKIINLLNGKDIGLKVELKRKMIEASGKLDFEKAAEFRDKIKSIDKITQRQIIILKNFENEDFINIYIEEGSSCVQIFFVRDGKVIGNEHYIFEEILEDNKERLIDNFIKEFYGGTAYIPKNIFVPFIEDGSLLEEWLTAKKGTKVNIKIPEKGEKKKILDLVKINAKNAYQNFRLELLKQKQAGISVVEALRDLLDLEYIPERIEAYDISNIQGVDSVGTMVVFENGKPKNSDYRRFKIKTIVGADDYGSMREILTRRFKRGLQEVENIKEKHIDISLAKFCYFPDLIMMDGGKGQVNIALSVLEELNITIPVVGMVKDDKHRTRALIYKNEEIEIKSRSTINKFVTRVQDEVHRFAISYHRSLRDKKSLKSVLEYIPNIGKSRRQELLKKFGSVEKIKKAKYAELIETKSINDKAAKSILEYFGEKQI
ncbi:excinuclease ABC subunit UvrC [Clostridium sp. DL1XJH146]